METNSYRRSLHFPWQELEGKALVLQPEQSMAHELNETATVIWKRLESPGTIEQLAEAVCEEFDVTLSEAKADVVTCLLDLRGKGLLE